MQTIVILNHPYPIRDDTLWKLFKDKKYILEQLSKNQNIRISDISDQLHISRETIRKDIYTLDNQGLVHAIRGGATLPESISETRYGKRQHEEVDEKKAIAQSALGLIHDGDSIFIDYVDYCISNCRGAEAQ
ncbi:Glycerol-3-phosphate regulon repressor [Lactiplantibacillus plantarum subsp. plantarum]|uniref:Glycerol-3-phosphate regulon repressor n=1 Tax=Lactiplantibacillus plantarum subsp. plantarum TaxID=337330 RepID=A0A2S3U7I4_LACPN|nr:Glycerol-3-phosphate regulon repressor [Lactiplantibacillus plantarum subsp. plantarum]